MSKFDALKNQWNVPLEVSIEPEARLELARLERRGILNPLCLPIPPLGQIGAGNEARTRDPDLGKVVLYQLSYSRRAFM